MFFFSHRIRRIYGGHEHGSGHEGNSGESSSRSQTKKRGHGCCG
jgi:hypothetical protein